MRTKIVNRERFIEAYNNTIKNNGTLYDLAAKLERSIRSIQRDLKKYDLLSKPLDRRYKYHIEDEKFVEGYSDLKEGTSIELAEKLNIPLDLVKRLYKKNRVKPLANSPNWGGRRPGAGTRKKSVDEIYDNDPLTAQLIIRHRLDVSKLSKRDHSQDRYYLRDAVESLLSRGLQEEMEKSIYNITGEKIFNKKIVDKDLLTQAARSYFKILAAEEQGNQQKYEIDISNEERIFNNSILHLYQQSVLYYLRKIGDYDIKTVEQLDIDAITSKAREFIINFLRTTTN